MVKKQWPVWSVAFSPDGCSLAAGRGYRDSPTSQFVGDGEVNVWHTEGWNLRGGFFGSFSFWIGAVAFTPDGKNLIAVSEKYVRGSPTPEDQSEGKRFWGSQDDGGSPPPPPQDGNILFFWRVSDGEKVQNWPIKASGRNDSVTSLAVSPDGNLIALGREGGVLILQRKTGRTIYDLDGISQSVAFSPDSKTLASVTESKPSIRLYGADNGKELANFELEVTHPSHVRLGEHGYELVGDRSTCVCFSPEGKKIAVGVSDGSVRLLAADLSKQLRSLEVSREKERVVSLAYSAKSDLLAAATTIGVRLFEASSGKQIREWGKADLRVSAVALSPDGKLLAVGYGGKHNAKGELRGGYVNIWDTATGRIVKKLD